MSVSPRYAMRRNPDSGEREFVYEVDRHGKVRIDKDGKPVRKITGWRVEVSGTDPVTGKKRRGAVGSFTLKRDADRADREAKIQVENGTYQWDEVEAEPKVVIPTVAEACETWLRIRALDVSINHRRDLESALRVHVVPAWGDMRVDELTHDGIQTVVLDWAEQIEDEDGTVTKKAKHPQTIARSLDILRGALDRQVRNRILGANPASGIVRPSVPKHKKFVPAWTDEEAAHFFAEAAKHPWAFAIWLGEIETMRRGEILGLTYSAIKIADDGTRVSASIVQTCIADKAHGGRPLLQPKAKSEGSERSVRFTKGTVEQFRLHKDRHRFVREAAGDAWEDHDLVFTDELGRPIRPDHFTIEFALWVESIGLPRMTPHALRHHAFTRMLREGVSPALAAQKGGHANVDLVYKTYGHLIEADQEPANEAIEKALERVGNGKG